VLVQKKTSPAEHQVDIASLKKNQMIMASTVQTMHTIQQDALAALPTAKVGREEQQSGGGNMLLVGGVVACLLIWFHR
jgi:hypothetical protein